MTQDRSVEAGEGRGGAEVERGVLAAAVGVMHQPARIGFAAGERHRERVDDELRVLVWPGRPADQAAVAEIADAGEIEDALVGRELGDVGDPALVWPACVEVTLQQVRGGRDVGASASPLAPRVDPDQPARDASSV
jgi:hypothetical protein